MVSKQGQNLNLSPLVARFLSLNSHTAASVILTFEVLTPQGIPTETDLSELGCNAAAGIFKASRVIATKLSSTVARSPHISGWRPAPADPSPLSCDKDPVDHARHKILLRGLRFPMWSQRTGDAAALGTTWRRANLTTYPP